VGGLDDQVGRLGKEVRLTGDPAGSRNSLQSFVVHIEPIGQFDGISCALGEYMPGQETANRAATQTNRYVICSFLFLQKIKSGLANRFQSISTGVSVQLREKLRQLAPQFGRFSSSS